MKPAKKPRDHETRGPPDDAEPLQGPKAETLKLKRETGAGDRKPVFRCFGVSVRRSALPGDVGGEAKYHFAEKSGTVIER